MGVQALHTCQAQVRHQTPLRCCPICTLLLLPLAPAVALAPEQQHRPRLAEGQLGSWLCFCGLSLLAAHQITRLPTLHISLRATSSCLARPSLAATQPLHAPGQGGYPGEFPCRPRRSTGAGWYTLGCCC